MEPDRTMTRFFLVLGGLLGLLAAGASLALHTWWPLAALGLVLLGVAAISLSEAAMFAPLLALILRAGERKTGASRRNADTGITPEKPDVIAEPPSANDRKSESGDRRKEQS